MTLVQRLRDLNERFRCEHSGGETAPFLREAADEISRLTCECDCAMVEANRADARVVAVARENAALRHALGRSRNVLNNMAMEHETGWRSIFARWPIHHEPLRSDARHLLPVIDAVLAEHASRDEETEDLFQSERISAALATYDYVLGDLEPDDLDREERVFDAMKAAIQRADHIALAGKTGER